MCVCVLCVFYEKSTTRHVTSTYVRTYIRTYIHTYIHTQAAGVLPGDVDHFAILGDEESSDQESDSGDSEDSDGAQDDSD